MFSRLVLIATTLTLSTFCATELTTYRSFHFGESPTVAGKQPGIRLADMRTMQKRPAMIQELDWRPEMSYQGNSKGVDPVRDGVLRFYNGELFQIVTTYNRDKVEGMTDADMITALSATYGVASSPSVEIPFHSNYGETAKVIARWGNDDYEYDLVRTGDQASFALVLSMKRLEKLAQASILEASRLDALEAPQRAIDAQKKLDADNRMLVDKARAANILNFIP
jgi:hypothetical protein